MFAQLQFLPEAENQNHMRIVEHPQGAISQVQILVFGSVMYTSQQVL